MKPRRGLVQVYTGNASGQGATIDLYQESGSPANNDAPGIIRVYGESSTSVKRQYGQLMCQITDVTNSSEDAQWVFQQMKAGTLTSVFTIEPSRIGYQGKLELGDYSTGDYVFTIYATYSVMSETTNIIQVYTENNGAGSSNIDFFRHSGTPAASDQMFTLRFYGRDSGANKTLYAEMRSVLVDPTNTSEDGALEFYTMKAGTSTKTFELNSGGVGFFGTSPATQQSEITDELTTITHTSPGTPDYAIQNLTNSSPYGFVTQDEGNSVLAVIANLQARVNELETCLVTFGFLADAD